MTKKLLVLAIMALSVLVTAPALAYYPSDGDLIKIRNNPSVYYVDANDRRHLFPTESTFFSWYTGSWKNQSVITVSESEFNQLLVGKNVTVRPGYALVRFGSSLKMYAVLPNGRLCRAPAHYGNYQYNRALVIPAGFESSYYNDGVCDITSNQKLPDGTLLRYKNSFDTYYIQNGQKRLVTDSGFTSNNFRFESVILDVDPSMTYPNGSTIYNREDALTKISVSLNYHCNPNWTCNSWSSCVYNRQYRTCTDSNRCGVNDNKPPESQSCFSCVENWTCNNWGVCQGGQQYRSCTDSNSCGTYYYRPSTSQACLCTENWSCTAWSVCYLDGQRYRNCLDINNCGTTANKPILSQTCPLY
ncbi:MAG: hypothetical protein WC518_01005 [Patescibacteria group bacterium]